MGTGRLLVGLAAGLTLIVVCGSAAVRPPDEIRRCLCLEQSIGMLQDEFRAQSMAYEQQREAFEALDEAVQTGRPQVNANNPADVATFKRLLQKHDDSAATLAGPASKSYTEAEAYPADSGRSIGSGFWRTAALWGAPRLMMSL
jgi:hypothetical protein